MINRLLEWNLKDFEAYNAKYDSGAFRGSEATKYNLNAIKKWIYLRSDLSYTEDTSGDGWKYLDITDGWHSKYGTNYILIHPKKRLWRVKLTGNEFYDGPTDPLD